MGHKYYEGMRSLSAKYKPGDWSLADHLTYKNFEQKSKKLYEEDIWGEEVVIKTATSGYIYYHYDNSFYRKPTSLADFAWVTEVLWPNGEWGPKQGYNELPAMEGTVVEYSEVQPYEKKVSK